MKSNLKNINFKSLLEELSARYDVVGSSLSVSYGSEQITEVSGLLNINTGVEVTEESLFQVGSISKVFTATLIMQLVEEGKLELDHKVVNYLPDFRVLCPEATKSITIQHLLTHTSGIEGDFFPKDDPFNPTTESLVNRCYLLPQLHPVGEYISYCNTGYTIAGRIIEVLRGKPWGQVVQEHILNKLDLKESTAFPYEMIKYRAAIGHYADHETQELKVVSDSYLPLSHAPAGTVLSMSSKDLLMFAKAHLNYGNINGAQIVSSGTAKLMRSPQFKLPDIGVGLTDWGLGWYLEKRNGVDMFGHTGGTNGQLSYLSVYPEHDLVITLLTNSPSAMLYFELEDFILQHLVGTTKERQLTPSGQKVDLSKYVGKYTSIMSTVEVYEDKGDLWCKFPDTAHGMVKLRLQHCHNDVFVNKGKGALPDRNIIFLSSGTERYVSSSGRMYRAEG